MSVTLRPQRTLDQVTQVRGFGYWSGHDVCVEFRPAPPDTGITFVRGDLSPPVSIPALADRRVDVPRRTNLMVGNTQVEMVEHLLAALAGLQIDNCQVWTDRPEMPGCDGSSQTFVDALLAAGIVDQPSPRPLHVIDRVVRVGDDNAWVEARPPDHHGVSILYRLDYEHHRAIGSQQLELQLCPETFQSELARARTFLLEEEAEFLRRQGLGERVSYADVLVFGEQGPIRNSLRFPDECVRHKALDLVGDMALAGCDFVGRFVAYRSGHRLHADLVQALMRQDESTLAHRKSA